MSRHKLFYQNPTHIRERLNEAIELAAEIHELERKLIEKLEAIDNGKFYVRYSYRSLTGFCRYALKFSRTQSQRIVTQVRRYQPTANKMDEHTNKPRCQIELKGSRQIIVSS
jgi:hypothetical protein